jgi:phytoene dehydrogenase-like protein
MKPDAIIIGAGVGGLTCAALLARAGQTVVVFEKNDYIGGACSSYQKNGYTFDRAVHLFTSGLNGPFGEVCRRLDITDLDFVRRVNHNTAIKIYGQTGYFPYHPDLIKLARPALQSAMRSAGSLLRRRSSDDPSGTDQVPAKKKSGHLQISRQTIIDAAKIAGDVLTMNRRRLRKLYDNDRTVTEWLNEKTQDPLIHGAAAFLLAGMFAISPRKAGIAETIYCFKKEMMSRQGYQYPTKGGAQAIPDAIAKAFQKLGGILHTNSRVEKIVVANNRVQGVMIDGQLLEAPLVISNLDIRMTVSHLVGEAYFTPDYYNRISSLKPSLSAMTFKLALKKPLIDGWGFVNLYHPTLDDWKGKYGPDAPVSNGFFGPVLSNIDPHTAPPGGQTVIFGTITPPTCPDWKKWQEIYWADLNEFYPGLEEYVEFMDVSFPYDITGTTGKPSGPVEGLGLTPEQTGHNKPSSNLPIEGLYVTGDTAGKSAHGIGTQLACRSGIQLADALLGEFDLNKI